MDIDKISDLIKTKRKERKITQEELADKLGVTEKAISRWETGRGTPDISLLIPLAKELKIEVLQRKIDTYNESIKVFSGSVRKLNEVVKDLEQKQPKIEPKNRMNTRAFIAGWDADEPEPLPQLISKEEVMQIIKANMNCQRLEPLPQQCIYPWQSGQFQSCAMPPLWYINRRLEDM